MTSITRASPVVNPFFVAASLPSSAGSTPALPAGLLAGKPVNKKNPVRDFTDPNSGGPTLKYGSSGMTSVNPRQTPGSKNTRAASSPGGAITAQEGLDAAIPNANPPNRGNAFTQSEDARRAREKGEAINTAIKPQIIKLPGDRQVILRVRNNGVLVVYFPDKFNLGRKRVSMNLAGVNAKSTPQAVSQAVQKLCSNPRVIEYVYDRFGNPTPNDGGLQDERDSLPNVRETFVEQRQKFDRSIESLPPLLREVVGFAGGIWYETVGKLGHSAGELINAQQALAKKITASPAAWKEFIDTSFDKNSKDPVIAGLRSCLASFPTGGAGDIKTTIAIIEAIDVKTQTKLNTLSQQIDADPAGVGKKLTSALWAMVKADFLEAGETTNFGTMLGALVSKLLSNWIPAARGGASGAQLLSKLTLNSPKLLSSMGKAGYEAAVATLGQTNSRLAALASKAKSGAGISAAEQAQQAALLGQLESAANAIGDNDPNRLKTALGQVNKTLHTAPAAGAGKSKGGSPRPRNASDDAFYAVPHTNGRKFLENSKFVTEGQPPAHFGNGNTFGLDIGDRLFDSPVEADAALARFIARKPQGEYSIRMFKVQHGNPVTEKTLVSIEPSEMKNSVTSEAQMRQLTRVRNWGIANKAELKQTRFDHNHPNERGNSSRAAIPSGVQDAKDQGDIQAFLQGSIARMGDKFAIWSQDSKTVVKLEFTIKASPLDRKFSTLSGIEDRRLFAKLFNDCFEVKIQKFDHQGIKIGSSKPFDVMGAISKERRDAVLEMAASSVFVAFGLYKALEWLENKDKENKVPGRLRPESRLPRSHG